MTRRKLPHRLLGLAYRVESSSWSWQIWEATAPCKKNNKLQLFILNHSKWFLYDKECQIFLMQILLKFWHLLLKFITNILFYLNFMSPLKFKKISSKTFLCHLTTLTIQFFWILFWDKNSQLSRDLNWIRVVSFPVSTFKNFKQKQSYLVILYVNYEYAINFCVESSTN